MDTLLGYAHHNVSCFAKLTQAIFGLFEALGLHTPNIVKRAGKIIDALTDPLPPPAHKEPFRFFAVPLKEKTKARLRHAIDHDAVEHRM